MPDNKASVTDALLSKLAIKIGGVVFKTQWFAIRERLVVINRVVLVLDVDSH